MSGDFSNMSAEIGLVVSRAATARLRRALAFSPLRCLAGAPRELPGCGTEPAPKACRRALTMMSIPPGGDSGSLSSATRLPLLANLSMTARSRSERATPRRRRIFTTPIVETRGGETRRSNWSLDGGPLDPQSQCGRVAPRGLR